MKGETVGTTVYCSWSGGIDSTALIGQLLRHEFKVVAIPVEFYSRHGSEMMLREAEARRAIAEQLFSQYDNFLLQDTATLGCIAECFEMANGEIPRRNRHLIDWMLARYWKWFPEGRINIGLGEYIGADSWVVSDHVPAADADSRALTSYCYSEWGLGVRLWTLANFGESRYKKHRLAQGIESCGLDIMDLTTNCMRNGSLHCGECYKCIERHAAFMSCCGDDRTFYKKHPNIGLVNKYMDQMADIKQEIDDWEALI